MKDARFWLVAGGAGLVLGAVGPWVFALGGVFKVGPTANLELTLIMFGGAALVAAVGFFRPAANWARRVIVGLGILAILEVVWAFVKIQELKSDLASEAGDFFGDAAGNLISPGWGLYVTALVGLYLIVAPYVLRKRGVTA